MSNLHFFMMNYTAFYSNQLNKKHYNKTANGESESARKNRTHNNNNDDNYY